MNLARQALSRPIVWILLFALFHGVWYVAIVHPWQAPDEYLHYQQLRLLDEKRSMMITADDVSSAIQWQVADSMWQFQHHRYRLIPTPSEANYRATRMPIGYTGSYSNQAPLYYYLSLPLYWAASSWPVLTQLYLLRLFSVFLLVATVWLTYLLAKLVFQSLPSQEKTSQTMALASAGVVALLPQFTFIGASYNNDNVAPPLVAAALYAIFKTVQERGRLRWLLGASALAIISLTAKRTTIAIVPLLGLTMVASSVLWWQSSRRILRAAGVLIVALVGIGLAGVILLLANPVAIPPQVAGMFRLGGNALFQLAGYLYDPARLLERLNWPFWSHFALESFWGWFAWLTLHLDPGVIDAAEWVTKFLLVGCALGALRGFRARRTPGSGFRAFALFTLALGLLITGLVMVAQYVIDPVNSSPQGRYLFPFISAFGILAVWGWRSWWPKKWQDPATLLGLALLMALDVISWTAIVSFFYS